MTVFSIFIVPSIIVVVVLVGFIEKKELFSIFCDGAKDGVKTVLKMFPTLIGIFLAISMLRNSGFLDFIADKIGALINGLNIHREIIPLALIKPISGSASMAVATDLMKQFGVDSQIGKLAGIIMSASETTLYVIAIYLGAVKIKSSKKIIIPALIGDVVSVLVAILCYSYF